MSLILNGSTQYAYILEALAAGRPLTIAGWCKSDSDSAAQAVASLADKDSDVNYRILGLFGSVVGDPVIAGERDSGNNKWSETTAGYAINTWQQVLAEFGSATSRKSTISGGNEGTESTSVTPANLDKTAIGVICRSTLAWFFSGKLAEIAMWDTTLTSQQKTDLADGDRPSTISGNLLAYWPLEDDADDDSGNSKNLTLVGTPSFDTEDHPSMNEENGGGVVAAIIAPYHKHLLSG